MRRLVFLLFLMPALALAGVEDSDEAVLLVAHPRLDDSDFAQTVIVVTFPQDTGPMGVILNRPIGLTLGELLEDRAELRDRSDMVYSGGPVQPDALLFLFHSPEHPLKAVPVVGNVYLSGDGKLFEALMQQPEDPSAHRFYAGYSGWAEGQLDAEVERGDWYVLPADAESIYDEATGTLWERLLTRATARTARSGLEPRASMAIR